MWWIVVEQASLFISTIYIEEITNNTKSFAARCNNAGLMSVLNLKLVRGTRPFILEPVR